MDFPINLPTQLGVHLRSRRRALGLTQAQVAKKMGLSQKRLSKLELNPDRITVGQLGHLAFALRLDLVLREKGESSDPTPAGEW